MDILRKELNELYKAQHLETESLDAGLLEECRSAIMNSADVFNGCLVITEVGRDRCFIYSGSLSALIGWTDNPGLNIETDSSDEDFIYNTLHPADLPDKRMLEYEFLKKMNSLVGEEKTHYAAFCTIRIRNREGKYLWIDNSTRIMKLSPVGNIWLILCSYDLAPSQHERQGISPAISNLFTGETSALNFKERRMRLLTSREKEILGLIRAGKSSKMIAHSLGIRINTVNRHRQNILEKLDVANSYEAVAAALSMNLI